MAQYFDHFRVAWVFMGTIGRMETVTHIGLKVPTMELCDRLRKIRRGEGLNQTEFAEALGIGKEAYSTYESGRNRPGDVVKLANDIEGLFGVASWWTLGLRDPRGDSGLTVTRQSLSLHTAPVVSIWTAPSQRLSAPCFIPSQQAG